MATISESGIAVDSPASTEQENLVNDATVKQPSEAAESPAEKINSKSLRF